MVMALCSISEQDLCFSDQKPGLVQKLKSQYTQKERTPSSSRSSCCSCAVENWEEQSYRSFCVVEAMKSEAFFFLSFFSYLLLLIMMREQFIFYGIGENKSIKQETPRECREVLRFTSIISML